MRENMWGKKITALLLTMVLFFMFLAADRAKEEPEKNAWEHMQDVAAEKAAFIEEKIQDIEEYVHSMAALAEKIYSDPDTYPDKEVALPIPESRIPAAQLLAAADLDISDGRNAKEVLKLGNMQDLLIEYYEQNPMVSSVYIATEKGWMIQVDSSAYRKYQEGMEYPAPYEAAERPWYILARTAAPGQVVYTEVFQDINTSNDYIVCAAPVYCDGKMVAVVGVDLYLETLEEMISQTRIGECGYTLLVDENERIIASSQREGEIEMDDTAAYLVSKSLSSLDWRVITVMDAEKVFSGKCNTTNNHNKPH